MRGISVVFMVFFYLLAMVKPVAPLLDYAINSDYIADNFCINKDKPEMHCDGKCHVKKEMEKETGDAQALELAMKDYPVALPDKTKTTTPSLAISSIETELPSAGNVYYSYLFEHSIFKPPRFVI